MKNLHAQFSLAAILSAALLLAGCNKPATPGAGGDTTIKVGEYASLTGSEASFGQSSHKGTQLAIDELNASGGVLGKQFQLITEDNQSQAGQSSTAVRKLISSDNVVAVLGEVASSRSMEAAPICQENKIPMISPSSTNPKVTETGDYIFRVCFIDPFQGTVMANFGRKTLKLNSAAILSDVKSDYSVGLAKFFKEGFLASGGSISAEEKYSGGDKDFNAQLTAIKAANPAVPDSVFEGITDLAKAQSIAEAFQKLATERPQQGGTWSPPAGTSGATTGSELRYEDMNPEQREEARVKRMDEIAPAVMERGALARKENEELQRLSLAPLTERFKV